jgi:predicted metalloprotease with PDZ domain
MAINQVNYQISIPVPNSHYAFIEMEYIAEHEGPSGAITLPTWTPGSYLLREFSRNVNQVYMQKNSPKSMVPLKQQSKNQWIVEAKKGDKIKISYEIYCFDFSVRTSYINNEQALLNMASVLMYVDNKTLVDGKTNESGTVTIKYPESWTSVATSLEEEKTSNKGAGQITFKYRNYDELVDSPVQLGNFETFDFEVAGVKHMVALVGKNNANKDQLKTDMQKICTTMFDIVGEFPCETQPCKPYVFIVQNVENGGGGIEHLNSTVLMMSRLGYTDPNRYRGFLGLVAHEYFHLWNVKRIRPVELGPFNYSEENYTRSLWIAEGITSYYDELALVRAGFVGPKSFLQTLSTSINAHENRPGSEWATLHDMSFNTWVKEYRPYEHSKNNSYSYYSKGMIVAALLDIEICAATKGKKSLDDVFKVLWKDFYGAKTFGYLGTGYTEEEFWKVCNSVAGIDLTDKFHVWLETTQRPDYKGTFDKLTYLEVEESTQLLNEWGLSFETKDGLQKVSYVNIKGNGLKFGIQVGDEILSINNYRTTNDIDKICNSLRAAGENQFTLLINRGGNIQELKGGFEPLKQYQINLKFKGDALEALQIKTNPFWGQPGAIQTWLRSKYL